MLDSVRDDPNLLQRVITGDEAWVYGYDVEAKAQSSQWNLPHEPRPKKAHQVRSNVKVLLTVFFDCRGVVHHEFLPQSITVNKEYYLQVMRNLREAIRQKRPDLWKNKNWLLHHDNAPAHTSLLVRDFLAKNNTLMMPQPPYSPDLAPCDFFLFPKLKRPMKGRRYPTLDEIKTASKEELKKILKNDFLKCFEDWKKPLAQGERQLTFGILIVWRVPKNHDNDCYFCVKDLKQFNKNDISLEKIKAGVFDETQFKRLLNDKYFPIIMNGIEEAAWSGFKAVVHGFFLGNRRVDNYKELVQNML
ncbi:hypothetical protein LAZ67_16002611 [Cordylochernes scorpioides]|uniref:Transposase n=1 Tax=Cordylochernes scorpioides TaxID=51811 RepID=A0ABY6LC46_9ARAC|nr:hypothetical protein LAZ67_16002611 [Cordylochernes scorpioides]